MKNFILLLLMILTGGYLSAQFLESFDTEIPGTWTIIDNDGQGNTWQHHTGDAYQGTGGARINFETENHDDYLISPQFTVIAGISDMVSFYAGGTGPIFPESFDVKLSTTGTHPSDFTVNLGSVTTIANIDTDGYVNYTYNLNSYIGSDIYIAIVATSPPAFHLFVDEFSVEALSDCPKPTNFSPIDITPYTITLDWDPGNSETNWTVKYGSPGFDPNSEGTSLSVNDDSTLTIYNLEPGTLYNAYVKGLCDGDSGESHYAGPLIFSTDCAPATIPFFESFENSQENGSSLAGCWTQESMMGGSWMANNTIIDHNRSPRTGGWDIFLSYNNEAWMFYEVNLTAGMQYTLSLFARQSNVAGANIKAAYGISNQAADMTNEIIPVTEITDGDYQLVSGNFTPDISDTYYIGINGHLNGGFFPFYMTVDDISIQELILCPTPTDLAMGMATPDSVTVSWTPGDSETEWLVKYGEQGFDPATEGNFISVSNTPTVTIPSLEAAHRYNVFVQALCEGDNGNSNFAGPISIATTPVNDNLCNAISIIIDEECTGSSYSNVGATMENSEPVGDCFDAPGDKTVWFSFEAPASGNVTVTTDFNGGTLTDTELAVYEAPDDCADLSTLGHQVGCDEDGGEIGDGFLSVVTLTDLQPGNTYYIQVNGLIDFSDGAMEGTFCVEVHDDGFSCPVPTGIEVSNIETNSAQVGWTPGGNETTWEIVYGETGFDPATEGITITDDDGEPGIILSPLSPDTSYDVYVRAICGADVASVWTDPESFTTQELSINESDFSNFSFYPNPTENRLILHADLPVQQVRIYNMLGQKVMELFPTSTKVTLSTSSLTAGAYIMSVTIDGTVRNFKLLKK
ncbi:MAG: fibronectin type III domain-containing protein [Moheibacter sp.]